LFLSLDSPVIEQDGRRNNVSSFSFWLFRLAKLLTTEEAALSFSSFEVDLLQDNRELLFSLSDIVDAATRNLASARPVRPRHIATWPSKAAEENVHHFSDHKLFPLYPQSWLDKTRAVEYTPIHPTVQQGTNTHT
jgi:hypothetical protein